MRTVSGSTWTSITINIANNLQYNMHSHTDCGMVTICSYIWGIYFYWTKARSLLATTQYGTHFTLIIMHCSALHSVVVLVTQTLLDDSAYKMHTPLALYSPIQLQCIMQSHSATVYYQFINWYIIPMALVFIHLKVYKWETLVASQVATHP